MPHASQQSNGLKVQLRLKQRMIRMQWKPCWGFAVAAAKTKTHYQHLELPSSATMAQIRQNYLRLAKIYHPDVYKKKDQSRFEKINEAYRILSDKAKRREYDREIGVVKESEDSEVHTSSESAATGKTNNMKYEDEKAEQIDLDEEYSKFFNQKSKTRFEQIRLAEDPEFRSMNEAERVRRHFSNMYASDKALNKTTFQKEFSTIMDDQIDQKNRHVQDTVEASKIYEKRNTKEGSRWLRWGVWVLFLGFCGVSIPLLTSVLTKFRLEREARERMEEEWKKIDELVDEWELNSRFKY